MEITWYGHACFRLKGRQGTVVTDPYDKSLGLSLPNLKTDIVTVSHDAPGHNNQSAVRGKTRTITGPGEYEIGGVFITGVRTADRSIKDANGHPNTVYVFDYDGVTIAHLGDLDRVPTQTQVEALGTVHVALVPVGGGRGLNAAKAAEVVSLLEPGIVIPMHFGTPASKLKLDPLSKFLKEMGLGQVEPLPSLQVRPTTVPEETNVVVLDYKR